MSAAVVPVQIRRPTSPITWTLSVTAMVASITAWVRWNAVRRASSLLAIRISSVLERIAARLIRVSTIRNISAVNSAAPRWA